MGADKPYVPTDRYETPENPDFEDELDARSDAMTTAVYRYGESWLASKGIAPENFVDHIYVSGVPQAVLQLLRHGARRHGVQAAKVYLEHHKATVEFAIELELAEADLEDDCVQTFDDIRRELEEVELELSLRLGIMGHRVPIRRQLCALAREGKLHWDELVERWHELYAVFADWARVRRKHAPKKSQLKVKATKSVASKAG